MCGIWGNALLFAYQRILYVDECRMRVFQVIGRVLRRNDLNGSVGFRQHFLEAAFQPAPLHSAAC